MSEKVFLDSKSLIKYNYLDKAPGVNPVEIGAVYFRRSNPPEEDWERDYQQAKACGHTVFRHWFIWSDIHVAPDTFDFSLYDKHLALAAKYGIKTIIAELTVHAPDWLYHQCPEGRLETADGNRNHSGVNISCNESSTAMCLDHPYVREQAGKFLAALADHYKDHPGLYGYDVWNETTLYDTSLLCYCPSTQARFREWCKAKYKTLDAVRSTWRRRSLTCWEDIELPRKHEPYPDMIDAIEFYRDNCARNFQWRLDILREHDPNHLMVAHGNGKTFRDYPCCDDMYTYGKKLDIYGLTYWYENGCHVGLSCDMTRMAADGREWWRAEALGNSDWQERYDNLPPMKKKDEMSDPLNIRRDAMQTFATGARAYLCLRWRPLQDGYLQGAYGWFGIDGLPTERSKMSEALATWCNGEVSRDLWKANPVRGEVGLLMLNEAQAYCYCYYGSTKFFSESYQGAYEAFLDSHIQADPICLDQIDDYDTLYCPYPYALSDETITRIKSWVEKGGTLISESSFGYLNHFGHVYGSQPNRGLDEMFGCVQNTIHLGADMWNDLEVEYSTGVAGGALQRQSYNLTTGKASGYFTDGQIAVVENKYGKGRTRLIGTMPGYSYHKNPTEALRRFFASHILFAGKKARFELPYNKGIMARLWANEDHTYLWLVNQEKGAQEIVVRFDPAQLNVNQAREILGHGCCVQPGEVHASCSGRDAVVLELL